MELELVALAMIAAVAAAIGFSASMYIARSFNFVDKPDSRKMHSSPTPLIGGLGVSIALSIVVLCGTVWAPARFPDYSLGLLLGVSIMLLIGVMDDRKPIRARYRFLAQILCGFAAILLGGTLVQTLGDVFVPYDLGLNILAAPFTVIAIAGLINAFNMADGIDGLCGSYSLTAIAWLSVCMFLIDDPDNGIFAVSELTPILFPTAASLIVFLAAFNLRVFGRSRATAFLGDNGSMILGLLIAWLSIRLSTGFGNYKGFPPVVAVWIVALPLFDMISCMVRRFFFERKAPMTADRHHMHHMILAQGATDKTVTIILAFTSFAMGLIGVAAWQIGIPQYVMFWSLFGLLVGYVRFHCRFWSSQEKYESDTKDALQSKGQVKPNPKLSI